MDRLHIPLHKLVLMLAHSVDLVGQDDYFHARRVGLIAAQLLVQLGGDEARQREAYYAGLLHDCGVSSTRMHKNLLNAIEWDGAEHHCRIGHDLLADFVPLARFAPVILHHHSRWSTLQTLDLPTETAALANLIFLADRIDVLCAPFYQSNILLAHVDSIRDILAHYRGSVFAPALIDVFLRASRADAFWIPLMSTEMIQEAQQAFAPQEDVVLDWPHIQQAAQILARIVDAKSPFTQRHSAGVARLAEYLAAHLGLPAQTCGMVAVSGLLHDIGKLQISDEILEAPRALDQQEIGVMRTHSFVTYRILSSMGMPGDMALWAASHHERLNGEGYPFRLNADHLPIESRIISVADVYQAFAQDRPYRKALAPTAIMGLLDEQVRAGLLDGDVIDALRRNHVDCHHAALAA